MTFSPKEVCSVIQFLRVEHISPIEIHWHLIEVYVDGIMGVQNVKQWCRVFKNGQTDIHDDDHTGWPSTSKIHVTTA
jgi:hypothetical protein